MTKLLEKQIQTFKLTEEQELLRKTIREIAEEILRVIQLEYLILDIL